MNYNEVTHNHLRLLKQAQDERNYSITGEMHLRFTFYIIVWSVAAICNALLAIAEEIKDFNKK